jgi:hypothetical protein
LRYENLLTLHYFYYYCYQDVLTSKLRQEAPSENHFSRGEKFRITLPENHTTGYMWQLNNNYDTKVLDYYGSVFHGNEKGVDFNFKTLEKGQK